MHMLWDRSPLEHLKHPVLARALDVLFILHIDHEQNCSTNAMRAVGSSEADPFLSIAGAAAALAGPLHGGANEEVLKMLAEGNSVKEIACDLNLSVKTVEAHKFNLMRKLDIHNKAQLVQYAIQKKIIKIPNLA